MNSFRGNAPEHVLPNWGGMVSEKQREALKMGEASGERPLISVIVPVYNTEAYLRKCLDSIIGQTYSNLEIILVDDGSTDQSGAICDEYSARDARIRVIHQENRGLGRARNAGIDIATGSLLAFVDSDDWLEMNAYEVMTACMAQYSCDIVTCGRKVVDETGFLFYDMCLDEGVLIQSGEETIRRFLLQDGMDMAAWDKLYKAELFDGVRYPSGHLVCEDCIAGYQVMSRANAVCLSGLPLYNYNRRQESITMTPFSEKNMGPTVYAPQVAEMARKAYPKLHKEANAFEIRAFLYVLYSMDINPAADQKKFKSYDAERKLIRDQLKQKIRDIDENPYVRPGEKMLIYFTVRGLDVPYVKLHHLICDNRFWKKLRRSVRRFTRTEENGPKPGPAK